MKKLTLLDWARRLDPDGIVAAIVELLEQTNDILADVAWINGKGLKMNGEPTRTLTFTLKAAHSTYELVVTGAGTEALPALMALTFEKDSRQQIAQLETENMTLRIERNAEIENREILSARNTELHEQVKRLAKKVHRHEQRNRRR